MWHLSEEKCGKCGQCCESMNKIYVFPEEMEKIAANADSIGISLKFGMEDVVFDEKNREVLIIRYSLQKTTELCPLYDPEKLQCLIYNNRPKSCLSLPLTFIRLDNESTNLLVLGPCGESYDSLTIERLQKDFPSKFGALQMAAARYQHAINAIQDLEANGAINLLKDRDPEVAAECIKTWKHVNIAPIGNESTDN